MEPWIRKIPWRRKWQPTPVFLPGESHGWRSVVGYSPWGRKESDTTERLHFHTFFIHSSVSVHLGCSNVLAIIYSAVYLFELWFSQGICPVVGLLGHAVKVKSESEVAQSCLTLSDPLECSLPGSPAAYQFSPSIGFSRQEYWSGCHFLLQEIFPTQGSNPGLPHCRQTL